MSIYKKSEGITLDIEESGEQDRLFTVYTKEYGKMVVLAKGARKIQSKLTPHLQPFAISDVMMVAGRSKPRLTDAVLKEDYAFIKHNLSQIAGGSYCLEMVDHMLPPDYVEKDVYVLLKEVLEVLNQRARHKRRQYIQDYFLVKTFAWKLLGILGFGPQIKHCVDCQRKIEPVNIFFDPERGAVCPLCAHGRHLQQLSKLAWKLLYLGLHCSLKELVGLRCPKSLILETVHIMNGYIKTYVESDLKSEVWLSGLLK